MTALLVAALGAVGSLLRWSLGGALQKLAGTSFPLGTLMVNLLGSAAIGAVMAVFAARGELDSPRRVALTAGLLGGFTTYSSFAYETFALLEERAFLRASLNVALTTILCLGACAVGAAVGRSFR